MSRALPQAWRPDPAGWVPGVTHMPSPNGDARPEGATIELLVVHNISLPPGEFGGEAVADLFLNRIDPQAHPYYLAEQLHERRVSAHFFVRRTGQVVQFVSCLARAWHAGQSEWRGRARCNDFSLGIELEGTDVVPFTAAQYESLEALTQALMRAYPIADVQGHADIARPPGRKTDPGPCFDWVRYRAALVGH